MCSICFSGPQRNEQAKGQQNSALSGTKPSGNFLNSLNLQPVASSTPSKASSQQKLHQQQHNLQHSGDDGDSDNGGSGNELCIKSEDLIIGKKCCAFNRAGSRSLGYLVTILMQVSENFLF